ncbi:MAG: hypothetical protein H9W81_18515, partial [Enterococcus sp.]|nr:hypothetical protein [Enterococcus sp.]
MEKLVQQARRIADLLSAEGIFTERTDDSPASFVESVLHGASSDWLELTDTDSNTRLYLSYINRGGKFA